MKKKYFIFIFASTIFLINSINLPKPSLNIPKQQSSINFDQKYLKLFNFGFSSMLSSWLWVKTLIESDTEHYEKRDLNSWMFLRFNSIINLDPKFYEVYLFGGKYLSIIKDDIYGAEIIFNKGIKQFPDDFWIHINAAHNYLFEMGQSEKAIPLYKKVQFQPIAIKYFPILPSLVSKLEKERGNIEATFEMLQMALNNQESEQFRKYYEENLYALRAEIDLNCLNSNRIDCNYIDFKGQPYIKTSKGQFTAKFNWRKFEISQKAKEKFINRKKPSTNNQF